MFVVLLFAIHTKDHFAACKNPNANVMVRVLKSS
jgi:hypothetical protein